MCASSSELSILEVVATGNERFSNTLKRLQRICPGRLCPLDDTQIDMLETIETGGPVVVFVPTEEAFQSLLGNINPRDILQEPEAMDALQRILAYHVVEDGASCDSPLSGVIPTLLPGESVEVKGEALLDGFGQRVGIIERIPASNGQVYLVDGILLPGNMSETILSQLSPSVETSSK